MYTILSATAGPIASHDFRCYGSGQYSIQKNIYIIRDGDSDNLDGHVQGTVTSDTLDCGAGALCQQSNHAVKLAASNHGM